MPQMAFNLIARSMALLELAMPGRHLSTQTCPCMCVLVARKPSVAQPDCLLPQQAPQPFLAARSQFIASRTQKSSI